MSLPVRKPTQTVIVAVPSMSTLLPLAARNCSCFMSATHAPYAFTEEVAMTVADAPESSNHQNSDCPSFQNSDKSGSKTGMYLRSSCETETVSCTFKNVEVAVLFKTTLLLTSETNPWENSAASPVEPSPCKPKNHGSCRFGGVVQLDSC